MRLIGELGDFGLAKKFAAYMMTEDITSKVEEEGGVWEVWVKEEDEQKRAIEEFDKFTADPDNPRYQGVLEKAAEIERDEEHRQRQFQKNVVRGVKDMGVGQRAPLTVLLIVLCGIVALLTNFGQLDKRETGALNALAFTSIGPKEAIQLLAQNQGDLTATKVRLASIEKGEVWRLVTPIFIHFGAMHLVFNMLWLFQFGRMVENRYGMVWFAILVVVTAIISNVVQCLVPADVGGAVPFEFPNGHLIMALGGMSGVVYGLFGFIWVKTMVDRSSGFYLPQSTIVILVVWLFIGGIFLPGIAHWAHGVGLAVGMMAGYLPSITGGAFSGGDTR